MTDFSHHECYEKNFSWARVLFEFLNLNNSIRPRGLADLFEGILLSLNCRLSLPCIHIGKNFQETYTF